MSDDGSVVVVMVVRSCNFSVLLMFIFLVNWYPQHFVLSVVGVRIAVHFWNYLEMLISVTVLLHTKKC